jgi:hypothetical protein
MRFGTWIARTGLVVGTVVTLGCLARSDAPLQRLLQQPISGEEHSLIARRYRERAAEARRLAGTHEVMAARYRDGAVAEGQLAQEMVTHCEALARDYADAAARYEHLAANHTSLAAPWRYAPGGEAPEDRGPWR